MFMKNSRLQAITGRLPLLPSPKKGSLSFRFASYFYGASDVFPVFFFVHPASRYHKKPPHRSCSEAKGMNNVELIIYEFYSKVTVWSLWERLSSAALGAISIRFGLDLLVTTASDTRCHSHQQKLPPAGQAFRAALFGSFARLPAWTNPVILSVALCF